jgi:hypothetical protein
MHARIQTWAACDHNHERHLPVIREYTPSCSNKDLCQKSDIPVVSLPSTQLVEACAKQNIVKA